MQTTPDPAPIPSEWLWGWDPTPGIVSVWAQLSGLAIVWRRLPEMGALVREEARFRPWMVLDRLDDLTHLGAVLAPEGAPQATVTYRELTGAGYFNRFHFLNREIHQNCFFNPFVRCPTAICIG